MAHKDGTIILSANIDEENYYGSVKIRLGDHFYTPSRYLEEAMLSRVQYSPDGSLLYNNNVINSLKSWV